MKEFLDKLNKAFESRARLGIMSVLLVNEQVDFTRLKELLDLTDGNLASHLRALEELQYVAAAKQFIGRKPNTTYQATEKGRQAFSEHLKGLEELIQRGN